MSRLAKNSVKQKKTLYVTEAQLNSNQPRTVTIHSGKNCPLVNVKFKTKLIKVTHKQLFNKCKNIVNIVLDNGLNITGHKPSARGSYIS